MTKEYTIDDTAEVISEVNEEERKQKPIKEEEYKITDIVDFKKFGDFEYYDKAYSLGIRENNTTGIKDYQITNNDNYRYGYKLLEGKHVDDNTKCIKIRVKNDYEEKIILIELKLINEILDIDIEDILYKDIILVDKDTPNLSYSFIIENDNLYLIDNILKYHTSLIISVLFSFMSSILFSFSIILNTFNIIAIPSLFIIITLLLYIIFYPIIPFIIYKIINYKYPTNIN